MAAVSGFCYEGAT